MKCNTIHIIGVSEGEARAQGIENLFEKMMTKNFPSLVKEKDTQVKEEQRVPNKMDSKRPTTIHIIIKMAKLKDKKRTLKPQRERQLVTYKGVPVRLSPAFSQKHFRPEQIGKNTKNDEK